MAVAIFNGNRLNLCKKFFFGSGDLELSGNFDVLYSASVAVRIEKYKEQYKNSIKIKEDAVEWESTVEGLSLDEGCSDHYNNRIDSCDLETDANHVGQDKEEGALDGRLLMVNPTNVYTQESLNTNIQTGYSGLHFNVEQIDANNKLNKNNKNSTNNTNLKLNLAKMHVDQPHHQQQPRQSKSKVCSRFTNVQDDEMKLDMYDSESFRKVRTVEATPEVQWTLSLDGEYFYAAQFNVRLVRSRVGFLYQHDLAERFGNLVPKMDKEKDIESRSRSNRSSVKECTSYSNEKDEDREHKLRITKIVEGKDLYNIKDL